MNKKLRPPKVRLAKPQNRPIQLRYTDLESKKEIRISTGTTDETAALEQKRMLEAKLLLGIDAKPNKRLVGCPKMSWEEFREQYRKLRLHGTNRKARGIESAEVRLDVAERILKPRTLADVANDAALEQLQAELLLGEGKLPRISKLDNTVIQVPLVPRSPHTVKSYMRAILAALNWAFRKKWLPVMPTVEIVKVSKLRHAKGRPLCGEEFDKLLANVEGVVGAVAKDSWTYTLRGLVESGLRREELMSMHWTDHSFLTPVWRKGTLPVIAIPAELQKNYTEESIPMLPGLEALLLETPAAQRFGFCFNPMSLQVKLGRRVRDPRPSADWVGKIICRIGRAAGVQVNDKTGKCASAQDLRRTTAQDLFDAEIADRDVTSVMRHSSIETTRRYYATGNIQKAGGRLRAKLASVPRYGLPSEATKETAASDTNP